MSGDFDGFLLDHKHIRIGTQYQVKIFVGKKTEINFLAENEAVVDFRVEKYFGSVYLFITKNKNQKQSDVMTEAVAHKSQLTIGLLDFEPLSSFVKGNNI